MSPGKGPTEQLPRTRTAFREPHHQRVGQCRADAAKRYHRAQRRDQRIDPQHDDDEPVQRAEQRARRQGRRQRQQLERPNRVISSVPTEAGQKATEPTEISSWPDITTNARPRGDRSAAPSHETCQDRCRLAKKCVLVENREEANTDANTTRSHVAAGKWRSACGLHAAATCSMAVAANGIAAVRRASAEPGNSPMRRPRLHHEIAIADAHQFFGFRGDHEHTAALRGEIAISFRISVLALHVEAAGRLVQQEQARLGCKPSPDDDLLLIAAAQGADRLLAAGNHDVQPSDQIVGKAFLAAAIDETARMLSNERRFGRAIDWRETESGKSSAFAAPVFGDEAGILARTRSA